MISIFYRFAFKFRQCFSFPVEEREAITIHPHTYAFIHSQIQMYTHMDIYICICVCIYACIYTFEVFASHTHLKYVLQGDEKDKDK